MLDRQTWRFVATGWGGRWGWNGEGRLIRINSRGSSPLSSRVMLPYTKDLCFSSRLRIVFSCILWLRGAYAGCLFNSQLTLPPTGCASFPPPRPHSPPSVEPELHSILFLPTDSGDEPIINDLKPEGVRFTRGLGQPAAPSVSGWQRRNSHLAHDRFVCRTLNQHLGGEGSDPRRPVRREVSAE